MNKKIFKHFIFLLFSYMTLQSCSVPNKTTPPPNIVLIVSDDANKAHHSLYGGMAPTPNLDSLALEGARFERAVCVTPMCSPSRFTLLTGCFPERAPSVSATSYEGDIANVIQNLDILPDTPNLGGLLREAGYFTGYVGKWHNGFEYGRVNMEPMPYPRPFDPQSPEHISFLEKCHANDVAYIQKLTGFEHVDALAMGNYRQKPAPLDMHNVEWQADAALKFLKKAESDKRPFFLYLAHSVPHVPNPHEAMSRDPNLTLQGRFEPSGIMPSRQSVQDRLVEAGVTPVEQLYGVNYGMVQIDDQVGTLLKKLEEMGVADNTIVIYVSDHGIRGKYSIYFPGLDMPVFMKWPQKIRPRTIVNQTVSFVDIAPTLLAAAGVNPDKKPKMDGLNLLPALEGKSLGRDTVFAETGYARSVIRWPYQYITYRLPEPLLKQAREGSIPEAFDHFGNITKNSWQGDMNMPYKPAYFAPEQLYHLELDPLCRINLADRPEFQRIISELKPELKNYTDSFERPFPLEKIDPVLTSEAYQKLAEKRMERVIKESENNYPHTGDVEWYYNFNLPDPDQTPPPIAPNN